MLQGSFAQPMGVFKPHTARLSGDLWRFAEMRLNLGRDTDAQGEF